MDPIYFFSGASHQDIKRELNCDQLFSQWHERKCIVKLIEYKKSHPEYTGRIMVDSGAFTAYTKGVKLDVDDYIDFLNTYGDDLFVFVACDTVPDPANMDYSYAEKTWENYLYMYDKLRPEIRDKLMPVFHYGEDFKWLRNMLEYTHKDGSHLRWIGLAISLEGTAKVRVSWGNECQAVIQSSSNPNVCTHAFGVGVKSVFENIYTTSTDATSWVKRAAFGMIAIQDKSIYISDEMENKQDGRYIMQKSKALQESVLKVIHDRGFTLEQLKSDSKARAKFNIIDTLEWVRNMNRSNQVVTKGGLW